jgi:hypothetical protein
MATPSKKLDPFLITGLILTLWAIANTYVDITRYGIDQGVYWWFCNLALIGMALGLVFKHRGWITGFLSIACFTQVFWLIDNQYRVFTGENLFGLVEFMYQPGLPLDEFLLSHYHYFTIPIAVIALIFLPQKKSNTLLLIPIFNPLIFGVSYFFFPATQNVNCIHEPCFPGLTHWAGPLYSFLFWLIIFLMHLLIGYKFENFFVSTQFSESSKQKALFIFFGFCLLATVSAALDTHYRLSLPSFRCRSSSLSQMDANCGFTLDYRPQKMLFVYKMKNRSPTPQMCSTYFELGSQTISLHQEFTVQGLENKRLEVVLPYPNQSVVVDLKAVCQEYPKK